MSFDCLDPMQFALLSHGVFAPVMARDSEEQAALGALLRMGLLDEHAAGLYVLTDAGRNIVRAMRPMSAPGHAG